MQSRSDVNMHQYFSQDNLHIAVSLKGKIQLYTIIQLLYLRVHQVYLLVTYNFLKGCY